MRLPTRRGDPARPQDFTSNSDASDLVSTVRDLVRAQTEDQGRVLARRSLDEAIDLERPGGLPISCACSFIIFFKVGLNRVLELQQRAFTTSARALAKNPYLVRCVGKDASTSEIKKNYYQVCVARFWRLARTGFDIEI